MPFFTPVNYRKTDPDNSGYFKKKDMKIACICIYDLGKPLEVPASKWVKEGEEYHITHVYHQCQQKGVKGVELLEFDISDCVPYNYYRLDCFAFTEDNIMKLIELMQQCTELDSIDINSIVDKLFLVKKLDGIIQHNRI